MSYMGLDIGTSGCKAVVFNGDGKQIALSYRDYNLEFSADGGAQLNSDEVIKKCFDVIRECTFKVEPGSIKGLAVSSQGEAFTAVGHDNEILCNAMVSSDIRSQKFIGKWADKFGMDKLYRITGHTAHPLFTVFKLMWFKERMPGLWKKTKYFLCFEDLFYLRLGLQPSISWSMAGRTMLFNVLTHTWDPEILKDAGISPEQLARPLPSGSTVGKIPGLISKELGLSENTLVFTGGHDQVCSALGAGITEPDVAMLGLGTVECIAPVEDKPIFSDKLRDYNLCTYNYTMDNYFSTLAYSLTGGNILKWYHDELGSKECSEARDKHLDEFNYMIENMPEEPSGLLVLPYFTPTGTPYFDSEIKGAILGLRLSTRRQEILRGLLEGVAFEMRLNLEILRESGYKIKELRATGGGAKSDKLIQLKSDVMGIEITTLEVNEAGCLGAAMLAHSSLNGIPLDKLAADWVKPIKKFIPRKQHTSFYKEKFENYKKLYRTIKQIPI